MEFNMYYITNTLGYEAMIHHLFFLWIIKTNCNCAHCNWKKAKISLLECKMLEVASTTSVFYFDGQSFTMHSLSWTKFQRKKVRLGA